LFGCTVECPPVTIGLGITGPSTSSVLLYNSVATQYNNGKLDSDKYD